MTRHLKVYLDTAIFNFAISSQKVLREKEITLLFLSEIKNGMYIPYVSDVVFEEIQKASAPKREDLLKLMRTFALESLPITEEAEILADHYVKQKIIPVKYLNDALHIAVASIHNLDVIVSWNFEHMVKLKTRREVQAVNTLMGYKTIEICSPQEMI